MDTVQPLPVSQVEHPVETVQKTKVADAEARRLQQIRATMGWAPAANRALTMQILGRTGRMGGLPSSRASLHHFAGMNTKFDVEDFLGLPQNRAEAQPAPRAFFEHEFDKVPLKLPSGHIVKK
jgi:hypothetical protein